MKKLTSWLALLLPAILVLSMVVPALADGNVPSPYAGLGNPFNWSDTTAQAAGKQLYQQSCAGCHGARGNSLPISDFSAPEYPTRMESQPDFYFWKVSEGELAKGMPPFKSSLTEQKRWQVLTYMWSLGQKSAGAAIAGAMQDAGLRLDMPPQAQTGEPVRLSAVLTDAAGKPISDTPVTFFVKVDFFGDGLAEIGEAITDDQGVASLEHALRLTGEQTIVARYGDDPGAQTETTSTMTLLGDGKSLYHADLGLHGAGGPPDILFAPTGSILADEPGFAPPTVFRIPGGIAFFPFMGYVAAVLLVWVLYMRIMYQVLRIPVKREIRDLDTRLVPAAGLTIMAVVTALLVFILVTGPVSHPIIG